MAERQRFADRTAIVTGAGGGIGEAYARALHAEGANVVIAELNEAAGQAVADSLGERTLFCLLYTSPSPRDRTRSRMPSSA